MKNNKTNIVRKLSILSLLTSTALLSLAAVATGKVPFVNEAEIGGSDIINSDETPYANANVQIFNFDQKKSENILDTGDYKVVGELLNHPSWTMGLKGQALEFDGSNGVILDDEALNFKPDQQPFTLSLWMRATPGTKGTLIAKGYDEPRHRQYQLYVDDFGKIGMISGGNRHYGEHTTAYVTDDKWHHIVLVNFKAKDGYRYQVFVDGKPASKTYKSGNRTNSVATTLGFRFKSKNAKGVGFGFTGMMDSVQIYDKALSPSGIQLLYEEERKPVTKSDDRNNTSQESSNSVITPATRVSNDSPENLLAENVDDRDLPTVKFEDKTTKKAQVFDRDESVKESDPIIVLIHLDVNEEGWGRVALDAKNYAEPNESTSYTWSYKGNILGNQSTQEVTLPIGNHTVTLDLEDDSGHRRTEIPIRIEGNSLSKIQLLNNRDFTLRSPLTNSGFEAWEAIGKPTVHYNYIGTKDIPYRVLVAQRQQSTDTIGQDVTHRILAAKGAQLVASFRIELIQPSDEIRLILCIETEEGVVKKYRLIKVNGVPVGTRVILNSGLASKVRSLIDWPGTLSKAKIWIEVDDFEGNRQYPNFFVDDVQVYLPN